MGKLLPVTLALGGLLGGLGAGFMLKPAPLPDCKVPEQTEGQAAKIGNRSSESGRQDNSKIDPDSVAENPVACISQKAAPTGGNTKGTGGKDTLATSEFAKLPTQFVVPVLDEGKMRALVVLSISLEVVPGTQEMVFSLEPRLRDAFLEVMFRHANSGGFDGNFTGRRAMEDLRGSLYQIAESQLGDKLIRILILDIVRQDVG